MTKDYIKIYKLVFLWFFMIDTPQNFRKLVFIGPPGVGKGTLSKSVESGLGFRHISTGEMFKQLANEGSELGIMAKEKYWGQGHLVSDNITNELVKEYLEGLKSCAGFVLDGYPRTLVQALFFDKLHPDCVPILFEVGDSKLYKRFNGRVYCPTCNQVYNTKTDESLKPTKEGFCDNCHTTKLIRREDDTPEIFNHRIKIFNTATRDAVNYYQARGKLIRFNANVRSDQMLGQFLNTLDNINPSR